MRTVPSTIEIFAVQAQVDEGGSGHDGRAQRVLEFYSVPPRDSRHRVRCSLDRRGAASPRSRLRPSRCAVAAARASPLRRRARRRRRRRRRRARGDPGAPTHVEPPPPPRQPPGFPLPYRQGYADGCASAARHRAQGRRALRQRRQLSHRLAGRPRAVQARSDARAASTRGLPMKPFALAARRAARPRLPRADVGRSAARRSSSCCTAGWMSRASFQFLVDALARRLARDRAGLRGFGRSAWQPQGYWFADYVADLDALLDALRAGRAGRSRRPQPRRQRRDDLRGRAAGSACARVVSLDGFGIPAETPAVAPGEIREVARRAARIRRRFAPYASLAAVADRLQKNNPRLRARQGGVPRAALGGGAARRHARACASDPRHKLPFPTRLPDGGDRTRSGAAITAPTLWIAAADSHIPRWLADIPRARRRPTVSRHPRAASRTFRDGRLVDDRRRRAHAAPRPAGGGRARRSRRSSRVARPDARASSACASRRGAYVALVVLTLIWGSNWIVMKLALAHAHPGRLQRRSARGSPMLVLFAALVWQRRSAAGRSRGSASIVTGFFQTTINFGSTTMALAGGGAGRTSVLVFTMPFWTLLHRVAGAARARARRCSGSRSPARSPGSRWSSSRGTGRATSRPSCGRCCRDSAGRRARSRPSISSAAHGSTCSISSRGRCCSACCR